MTSPSPLAELRHHGFRPSKRYIVFQLLPALLAFGDRVHAAGRVPRGDTAGNDAVATELETVMTEGHEHEDMVLDVLKRAVAEALERKRRLGQYAVIWREGRVVCTGPDAPGAPAVPSTGNHS